MSQCTPLQSHPLAASLNLPAPTVHVLPGVPWGHVDAFPSPAYWAYQTLSARMRAGSPRHKLGSSLVEEVAACLLGGHGIPASVGLAAFASLKEKGAFTASLASLEQLQVWLSTPLLVQGRPIRYRFAAQKSAYLHAAIQHLANQEAPKGSRELRAWLMEMPGIGYKTASWIVRNWQDSDEVAILDVHILRVGRAVGLFPASLTVERHYLALEELFLGFSKSLGVRASELDAVIWAEMASSPLTVRLLDEQLNASENGKPASSARPQRRHSNSNQLELLV